MRRCEPPSPEPCRTVVVQGLAAFAFVLAATGCGDNGTGSVNGVNSPAETRIVSGDGQVRLPGSVLLTGLEVQAVDASGEPIAQEGLVVTWTLVSGGGSLEEMGASTDPSGTARARWRLGPSLGDQSLAVAVSGTPAVTFTARAVKLGPILFVSDRAVGEQNLFRPWRRQDVFSMNADGSDVVQLTAESGQESAPVRSPDGSTILFQRISEESAPIQTMLFSVTNLTETPFAHQDEGASGFVWSPDGTKLAFERLGDHGCAEPNSNIWVVDADGTNPIQLTQVPCGAARTETSYPDWSPDGRTIVYNLREGLNPILHTVWTMAADGSNQTQVSIGPGRFPHWLPDGRRVVVGGHTRFDNVSLRVLDTETGEEQTIWKPGGLSATALLPGGVSPDGRFAVVMLGGRGVGGIYRIDLDTGEVIAFAVREPLVDGYASWWSGTP